MPSHGLAAGEQEQHARSHLVKEQQLKLRGRRRHRTNAARDRSSIIVGISSHTAHVIKYTFYCCIRIRGRICKYPTCKSWKRPAH